MIGQHGQPVRARVAVKELDGEIAYIQPIKLCEIVPVKAMKTVGRMKRKFVQML